MSDLRDNDFAPVPPDRPRIARRLGLVLLLVTGLSSMASIAVATVNTLVAAGLAGAAAAGLPSAAVLAGQAISAYGWGRATDRFGWRSSLSLGLLAGCLGLAIAATAVVRAQLGVFLLGLFLSGLAYAIVLLSRFAVGEIVPVGQRARAISTVVLGGTLGAVFGPLLVAPLGRWATTTVGVELAGPYVGGSVLLAVGGITVLLGLWPDPRRLALTSEGKDRSPVGPVRLAEIFARPGVRLGAASMVFAQLVMVMLMVISSLHMRQHGHALAGIAAAISAHTVGMFAFSAVTGRMADRLGRRAVIACGAAVILVAALMAPASPRLIPLSVSLFLLGFGWNLCFVGGSALFGDHVRPEESGRAQGFNDLLVNSASAIGSIASGIVFASAGYAAMAVIGALLAAIPLLAAWRYPSRDARPAPA